MNNHTLGSLLRKYRESCGYTQKQVANALNIDRSTYTYYELGKNNLNVSVIIKLSKIFNVPYTEFINCFLSESEKTADDNNNSVDCVTETKISTIKSSEKIYTLTSSERQLIAVYRVLSDKQKKDIIKNALELNSTKEQDN